MKRAAILVAFALSACTSLSPSDRSGLRLTEDDPSTQILVTVRQDRSTALSLVGDPDNRYLRRRGYGPAPSVDRTLARIARDYDLRRVRGWLISSLDVYCEVFQLAPGRDVDALLQELERDVRVDLAQRMNEFEALGTTYNDPLADLQTSMASLDVEPAHRLATGRGVKVAVIDSQIDVRHPELRHGVEITRDLVDGGIMRSAAEVHGTAVAGIIASAANNTEGIVGIAPDVELAALRACRAPRDGSSAARCSSFTLAQALEVAIRLDSDIVNLSLAGPRDPLLGRLLDTAMNQGIVVVAALPEAFDTDRNFPASHRGVIAVSSGNLDTAAARDRYGLLLSAPGQEIISTTPSAGYAFFTGNSFAAAHVSGVAALLLERAPGADSSELFEFMTASATDASRSVNACRAVAQLAPTASCVTSDEAIARQAR